MSIKSELAAGLAELINDSPTSFTYLNKTYCGLANLAEETQLAMSDAGYSPEIDLYLHVLKQTFKTVVPVVHGFIYIGGIKHKIMRVVDADSFFKLTLSKHL